jgi:hypothetical protein
MKGTRGVKGQTWSDPVLIGKLNPPVVRSTYVPRGARLARSLTLFTLPACTRP